MFYKIVTAQAPVNIAVIKYWGKAVEHLKIPINDSISGTLSTSELSTTTSAALSHEFEDDKFWLNGTEQQLDDLSPARRLLEEIRLLSKNETNLNISHYKIHIVSVNNFPTAAGLASSAAGYACLAFVLGHLYGITELRRLSTLARKGSGSACRSLFGGFVQWHRGEDSESSIAEQVVDEKHWPKMRVVICVVNDSKKDVSSSIGMARSVATSKLLALRSKYIVPDRVNRIKEAIFNRDFEEFAELTMQDSNQFHAVCLDTWPPIFYLNDVSRAIINLCSRVNDYYGKKRVAYTFDAGPNACLYVLDDFVDTFISLITEFFPEPQANKLDVRGLAYKKSNTTELVSHLKLKNIDSLPNSLKYIINTSIGRGPKLCESPIASEHLSICKSTVS